MISLDTHISPMDLLSLPPSLFDEFVATWGEQQKARKQHERREKLRSRVRGAR